MVKSEVRNNTALILLNRPEKRNALNPEITASLKDSLLQFRNDNSIKTVILSGEGKSFCAGADLALLKDLKDSSVVKNEEDLGALAELFLMIYDYPKPVIAAVNGPAIGGGCGLVSVCDFVFADKSTSKFGYSEVKLGFIPAIVSVFLVKRIGEGKAKQLLISGEIIDAAKALSFGIADYLSDNVIEDSFAFAEILAGNSAYSVSFTKELIRNCSNMDVHDAVNYCKGLNIISRSSKDFITGINKFINKS
jgi:methylglutaconyl-CoA hydratase